MYIKPGKPGGHGKSHFCTKKNWKTCKMDIFTKEWEMGKLRKIPTFIQFSTKFQNSYIFCYLFFASQRLISRKFVIIWNLQNYTFLEKKTLKTWKMCIWEWRKDWKIVLWNLGWLLKWVCFWNALNLKFSLF